MRTVIVFVALLLNILELPAFATGVDPTRASTEYLVETHVLSVSAGREQKLVLQSAQSSSILGSDAEKQSSFFDIKQIKLGNQILEIAPNGSLLWDGRSKQPSNSPFQLIGSPGMLVLEGVKASVMQADSVEYFEKSGDTYLLQNTPPAASPSISITDLVIEAKGKDHVIIDFRLILSVMTGRRKLASTKLDVGEPILAKKEIEAKLETQLNQWFIPALFVSKEDSTDNKEYMIVLMRIR